MATITASDVGAVNREVQDRVDNLNLPPGVDEVKMGGVAETMEESFHDMYIAIGVAIVIAYAVMVFFMRSFLNPLIIMVSLPLAFIGVFLSLLITGRPLGISSLMGILMLVGIVLTNAIVLIALVEQLRKEGMSTYDALIEGGRTRLRPILMTALTTMLALFPLALGLEESTLLAAELGTVVIGGLFTSTLLTLLVIPVIYSLVDGLRHRKEI
jgi:HAE1 family hydrophobic/amphiphilic exporter-1